MSHINKGDIHAYLDGALGRLSPRKPPGTFGNTWTHARSVRSCSRSRSA